MNYTVLILPNAQRQVGALPRFDYEKIKAAIAALAESPRPSKCKKLSGRDGWRIRIGNYRVIYEINDPERIVTILGVGHRREVYR